MVNNDHQSTAKSSKVSPNISEIWENNTGEGKKTSVSSVFLNPKKKEIKDYDLFNLAEFSSPCELYGIERQSSEVRDSSLGFHPCWTSPPCKHPSDVHPRESLCPLFFLSVRATHLSKQSVGSSPLLILHLPLPLPIFSSLPSSSFKGIEHRYIRTFSHCFSYKFNSIIHYYATLSLNF